MTLPWWIFWLGLFGISTFLGCFGYILISAGKNLKKNNHGFIGTIVLFIGILLCIPGIIGFILAYNIHKTTFNEDQTKIKASEKEGYKKKKNELESKYDSDLRLHVKKEKES